MSELLLSGLIDNNHHKFPYQGFYNIMRIPEYYGKIQFTCAAGIFHDYAHLIADYNCDIVNIVGLDSENFRFIYEKIPQIEKIYNISISSENNDSIDKGWNLFDLENFINLKSLSIFSFDSFPSIDLSSLRNLDRFICQYKINGLDLNDMYSLSRLKLFDFKESNFEKISKIHSLKKLAIINTSIKNFDGIESLENLEMLYIDKARSLSDLKGVIKIKNIKHLWFGSHIKNSDWGFIKEMQQLKSLHVEKAENIYFLNELPNLEFFSVTKIINGDHNSIIEHKKIRDNIGKYYGMKFPFII
ncbi:hypothetical protein BDD26_0313 [Xenorhabdus cabanillasii]|uniref:Leucine rich repeat (LRR) protein n=1 Tax=Xenorhabdus cabanillasii TaxID=351673 RepID=A0A3D9U8H8_9GAMM|nr:hypothetical protein [Xenorhabdus cabanillasii]REF25782.1 hypothetical protein BDD26_0313 [Xenorhabdus cabanillasii]